MAKHAGILELYEEEMLNAPFVEYTKDNPPSLLAAVLDGISLQSMSNIEATVKPPGM